MNAVLHIFSVLDSKFTKNGHPFFILTIENIAILRDLQTKKSLPPKRRKAACFLHGIVVKIALNKDDGSALVAAAAGQVA